MGRLGNGALRLSTVPAISAGSYLVDLYYTNPVRSTRSVALSVNGGPAISVSLPSTSGTTGLVPISVNLNAGANTLTFSSASSNNIQIDRIAVHR